MKWIGLCIGISLACIATLWMATPATAQEAERSPRLLRHVVAFKFKESASPQDIRKVEEAFAALPSKISEIKGYEWGMNNSPEGLNKGCTHGFILTFHSEADRDAYLIHPDHKKFGELVGKLLAEVFVIDFWASSKP